MTIKQILEVLNKKIDEGFGCMKIGRMENDTFNRWNCILRSIEFLLNIIGVSG